MKEPKGKQTKTKVEPIQIKVKRLHPDAVLPIFKTEGAVGADLTLKEDLKVFPFQATGTHKVPLGFAMEIPKGYHAKIYLRSSTGLNTPLRLSNGTGIIDSDYRGEVCLLIENIRRGNVYRAKGERIAQIIIERNIPTAYVEVEELSDSERGDGGFGSTGK